MIQRLGRLADGLLALAAVVLLLAMLGSVFAGVVFRLVGRPLAFSDELAQYLLVWTGFVGWIIAGNRGSHIRVTVLLDRLRGVPRRLAEVAIQLMVAAFGVLLLTKSLGLIQRNLDVHWVSLPLSVALVYIPIPLAGAAVILQAARAIAEAARGDVRPVGGPAL